VTYATAQLEITRLMGEVRRYLIAVEAFRAEGQEPRWLPEERVSAPSASSAPQLGLDAPVP
jgi:hypothetical protein